MVRVHPAVPQQNQAFSGGSKEAVPKTFDIQRINRRYLPEVDDVLVYLHINAVWSSWKGAQVAQ